MPSAGPCPLHACSCHPWPTLLFCLIFLLLPIIFIHQTRGPIIFVVNLFWVTVLGWHLLKYFILWLHHYSSSLLLSINLCSVYLSWLRVHMHDRSAKLGWFTHMRRVSSRTYSERDPINSCNCSLRATPHLCTYHCMSPPTMVRAYVGIGWGFDT